jgi:hypothetical protein
VGCGVYTTSRHVAGRPVCSCVPGRMLQLLMRKPRERWPTSAPQIVLAAMNTTRGHVCIQTQGSDLLQIDGIWHTGVVLDGQEYFFGQGIQHCKAGTSPFGSPMQILDLGYEPMPLTLPC